MKLDKESLIRDQLNSIKQSNNDNLQKNDVMQKIYKNKSVQLDNCENKIVIKHDISSSAVEISMDSKI